MFYTGSIAKPVTTRYSLAYTYLVLCQERNERRPNDEPAAPWRTCQTSWCCTSCGTCPTASRSWTRCRWCAGAGTDCAKTCACGATCRPTPASGRPKTTRACCCTPRPCAASPCTVKPPRGSTRETPSHRLSFLEVLARIECLEVLHLHVGVKTVLQYSGQLGQDEATVPLRELQIRACKAASKWTVQRAVPEDLVLDLVRRAGAGLRELRLDGRWPVPPRVLQQLDRSQLRDVSAHSSVLGMAAKALRSVERLTLSVMLDQDGGADDVDMEDPDADSAGSDDEADGLDDQPFQEFMADLRTSGMALVSAALARCEAAASLRMLALTVTDVDLAEDENFRVDCRKLVDAFKERRPLVQTQLDFHCTFRAEAY
ncbi:uncharacterized protein LOC117651860 isoform X8 [Thrips palmi]|uniref:Uncharacterized protein LOC117651860 isoform X8 n=1 Tax=Thrips palmi TaxID=161013 RepID=A0A6P9A4Y2_THRPL|nr:uncharacterized protein LOC117651860 isoform X8 [Thrips palmi]